MIYPVDLVETVTLYVTDNLKDMSALKTFKDTKEEDMINYHFNIGMELRNHYKLWESKIEQLDEFGFEVHPDDISFEFIKEAQRQINDIQVG